nr:stage V sporulation protein D [Anaeromonas gelatinilytica]
MLFCIISLFVLSVRLFYIQIINGEKLREGALEQWTRDIPVPAKRGIIYDRNNNVIATNISSYTVWCRPADVVSLDKDAITIANILDMEKKDVYESMTKTQSLVIIKKWIDKEEADKLRNEKIRGIEIVDDNQRYYPLGNFASHILGFTDIDNYGLYGVEKVYDKYLTGINGRWIKAVDGKQRELPYDNEGFFEPQKGMNLTLTIDETIQHIAEKAALEALVKNKAKNVSIILMDPNSGELLAMATKPDYDPNDNNSLIFDPEKPWVPLEDDEIEKYSELPWDDKSKILYESWRNFSINDNYEPGSTFKIITAAAALEENVVSNDTKFHCDGYVRQIKGANIKCWRYYNPHGSQTFVEGVQNSCNEVFVNLGLKLGKEKMHENVKKFGFGENTGISLTGETSGIVRNLEDMKEVNLATISFGQGISVTPIQMVTAISAVANGGNLMEPKVVKNITDDKGNIIHDFERKVVRRVISEKTSKNLLEILESVVSEGTGSKAYQPGYKIGGKTGTAQKVVDGKYAPGTYIASFAGIAPTDDPKVVGLVVIDEPSAGIYYGGQIAAPVIGQVLKETLDYLDYEPQLTSEEKEEFNLDLIEVPNIKGMNVKEAAKKLDELELGHVTDVVAPKAEDVVKDQLPKAGTKVKQGEIIELYIKSTPIEKSSTIVPNLMGKDYDEVVEILNSIDVKFTVDGEGKVISQSPKAGTIVNYNTEIRVNLEDTNLE